MFVLGNLIFAIAEILNFAVTFYMWVVIISAVLSWVSPDPYNPIVRFIHALTDPVLSWFRRRLPLIHGGVDLSPLVVIAVILFIKYFFVGSMYDLARRWKQGQALAI